MKIKTLLLLLASHASAGLIGISLGIYLLPILIAPDSPSESDIAQMSAQAQYTSQFTKDLQDSDAFHWGDGQVAISPSAISFIGTLSPGPNYKLYLSSEFVETEADFNRLKSTMVRVGDVNTFENFIVPLPSNINPSDYNSIIIWCEAFGEFITSAQYR